MKRVAAIVGAVLISALVVVLVVTSERSVQVADVDEVDALLSGVPQRAMELGDPAAPVLLEEFVDMQCPHCAEFAADGLPYLVENYVRSGRLRIRLRLLTFLGADSDRAARFVFAAGKQDRAFTISELLFRSQGSANSGYLSDTFLRELGASAGVNVAEALRQRTDTTVTRQLEEDLRRADEFDVKGTPGFVITRDGNSTLVNLQTATKQQLDDMIEAGQ